MLTFGQGLLRQVAALIGAGCATSIVMVNTNLAGFIAVPILAVSYFAFTSGIKFFQKNKLRRTYQLTRSEFKYIDEQMTIAKGKIRLLNQTYTRVRSMSDFKQLHEMTKVAKNITRIVRENPTKFYAAEPFFYSHLDSAVKLTEKYSFLTRQPSKDRELTIALSQARETLEELTDTLQMDLDAVLASDLEHLQLELDYAKHSHTKRKKELEWRGDDK